MGNLFRQSRGLWMVSSYPTQWRGGLWRGRCWRWWGSGWEQLSWCSCSAYQPVEVTFCKRYRLVLVVLCYVLFCCHPSGISGIQMRVCCLPWHRSLSVCISSANEFLAWYPMIYIFFFQVMFIFSGFLILNISNVEFIPDSLRFSYRINLVKYNYTVIVIYIINLNLLPPGMV